MRVRFFLCGRDGKLQEMKGRRSQKVKIKLLFYNKN